MNKAEIKREYKSLVKQGKEVEANVLLDSIRLGKPIVVVTSKEVKKTKPLKKKEESLNSLRKIKGIGNKTVKDIKRICDSIEELKMMIKDDKLPLRDDIVIKLKNHLGVGNGSN